MCLRFFLHIHSAGLSAQLFPRHAVEFYICFLKFSMAARRRFERLVAKVRPSLNDVERLSLGEATSRRGIGSRRVPHRLNADERTAFQLACARGFAVVHNSGHRRERKGSPLLNTLRQRADALGQPLIYVERRSNSPRKALTTTPDGDALDPAADWTCIDYSPVRCSTSQEIAELYQRTQQTVIACCSDGIVPSHVQTPWRFHGSSENCDQIRGPSFEEIEPSIRSNVVDEKDLLSLPVWALLPCVVRYAFDDGGKQSRRVAQALAHEFGLVRR